jgi:hypothetical protein
MVKRSIGMRNMKVINHHQVLRCSKVSRSFSLTADTIAVTRCVLEKLVWQIAEVFIHQTLPCLLHMEECGL